MASVAFAPRSKEFHRGMLERKLFQQTRALDGSSMPDKRIQEWRKLFSQHNKRFRNERQRRKDDIKRSRAIGHMMRVRIHKGAEEAGAEVKWFYIAKYEEERPGELEDQHRAWIITELEKRFEVRDWESAQHESTRDLQARKAASRLLQETLAMKNRGGIPSARVAWLEAVLGEKSMVNAWEDKETDDAAREFGVNYIAACRREANVQQELETLYTHRGYRFECIDQHVTKAKLEQG